MQTEKWIHYKEVLTENREQFKNTKQHLIKISVQREYITTENN